MTTQANQNDLRAFAGNLTDAIQKNPLPAALIGMGVAWLFAGRSSLGVAADLARHAGVGRVPNAVGDAVNAGRAAASNAAQSVGGTVSNIADTMGRGVSSVGDQVTSTLRDAGDAYDGAARAASHYKDELLPMASRGVEATQSTFADALHRQPLLVAAVGVVFGAGVAALLPVSEIEATQFGKSAADLKDQAVSVLGEAASNAADVASSALSTASHEAERQGLTADNLARTATALGDKVKGALHPAPGADAGKTGMRPPK
jgi:hypothetical protein